MTMTGLDAFDAAVNTSNVWLRELMDELGWTDRHRAYYAFRAVLHTLRNRLPVQEVVQLGAQLPVILRGVYYDGWQPADKPTKDRTRDEFLAHIGDAFLFDLDIDAKQVTRAVFSVLARHVSAGEIEDVKHLLPELIRDLWN